MPAGRKPLPTTLVDLHGSPSHRNRANKREPQPPPIHPGEAAPASLTEAQAAEWAWVMQNAPPQMLRKIDRSLLASWCIQADIANQAGIELGKVGPFYKHKTRGPIISSAFRVHQAATMALIRVAAELGFSPTSRSRIFSNGWEDRPAGPTLVPQPGAIPLSVFLANAPGRRAAG